VHTHSHNKGNFLELCSLFAIHDDVFASNLQKYFNLTGHVLQNQLIQIAANHVTRRVAEDIANAGFFCILADEARSFKSEQLALCVRYTNDKLEVKERFVGFVDCSSNSDADGIATAVLEGIEATGLSDFPEIVAQSYDERHERSRKWSATENSSASPVCCIYTLPGTQNELSSCGFM